MEIETSEIIISEIMKRINQLYTIYFNNKYNLVGHLFQGRYYWELIQEDKYALETSIYIHLNPVRANMVNKPEEYNWSSYSMYIDMKEEKIINSDKILSYFKRNGSRELYRKFVKSAIKTNLLDEEN